VALLTACTAATDDGAPAADGPIRFAVVYGVTGPYAGTAQDFLTGFNAGVDDINAHGGVNGRQIQVKVLDDKSDPANAVSLLTDLLDSTDAPDVIVPGGVSSEVLAMLPLTTDRELFSVSPATSPKVNVPTDYPQHFGVSAKQAEGLTVLGDDFKAKGIKTLAVVLPADAFGDSVLAGIKAAADQAGVRIVSTERPDPNALNFMVEYQRVQAAKPDAVFSDFASQDAIARLFAARQTVGATDIPLYGGASAAASVPSKLAQAEAITNCQLPVFSFTVAGDVGPEYLKPLVAAFRGSERGIYAGGLGWDSVQLAALAFKGAGEGSPAEALLSNAVPEETLALFPAGTAFTMNNHFPELTPGSMVLVPCTSGMADGLWSVKK
jgi:branched-chain amino acid transport system substrate-binding protein